MGLTIESCGRADELPPVHPPVKNTSRGFLSQPAPSNLDCQDAPVLVAPAEIKKLHEGISGRNVLKTLLVTLRNIFFTFRYLKISSYLWYLSGSMKSRTSRG